MARKSSIACELVLASSIAECGIKFSCAGTTTVVLGKDLPSEMQLACFALGLKNKVIDAAAINRDTATGLPASDSVKLQAMQDVIERLKAGEWSAKRGNGGGIMNKSLLLEAISAVTNKPLEVVEKALALKSDEELKQLSVLPNVAAKILELKAARLAARADSGNLLENLFGDLTEEEDDEAEEEPEIVVEAVIPVQPVKTSSRKKAGK